MNASVRRVQPLVLWPIDVYDCSAADRFPLKRKWYKFDYRRSTDEQTSRLLSLLEERRSPVAKPAPTSDHWQTTFEIGPRRSGTSREILRLRHLFTLVSEDAIGEQESLDGWVWVSLPFDSYFETENGQPISKLEMFDAEARRKGGERALAILFDVPESVLRLNPPTPIRPELWDNADTALLPRLFEVYEQLVYSRWASSECAVSPLPDEAANRLSQWARIVVR